MAKKKRVEGVELSRQKAVAKLRRVTKKDLDDSPDLDALGCRIIPITLRVRDWQLIDEAAKIAACKHTDILEAILANWIKYNNASPRSISSLSTLHPPLSAPP